MNSDKLVIGGHEFDSRFILGSGKYSLKLIEAAVKDAGAQIVTLAVRRANTTSRKTSRFCRTRRALAMPKKPFASQDFPVNSVAVTS